MSDNPITRAGDVGAVMVAGASVANMLPSIAAALSIIWLLLRIWESDTVRGWTGRSQSKDCDE